MIVPVRHASGRSGVADQDSVLKTLGSCEQFHGCRMKMHAVGNNIGGQSLVRKNRAQYSRTAMIKWSHGIESMGCMPGSSRYRALGRFKIRIGMTQAHADSKP